MTDVVIDPFILAYPTENDIINFEDYIFNILEIKEMMDVKNIKLLISKNTSEILTVENNYPEWADLDKSIKLFGLSDVIQPKDVIVTLNGILKSTELEERTNINEILYDKLDYDSSILNDFHKKYRDEIERLFVLFVINQKLNGRSLMASVNDNYFFLKGQILDVESTDKTEIKVLPKIEGGITTFSNTNRLYDLLDPILLWKNAYEEEDFIDALHIYLYQRSGEYFKVTKWRFGDTFFEKAKLSGFLHEEAKIKTLLKCLADTLLEENLNATHALRDGAGAKNSQVTRGKDKAWRRDIDYEYHLHYWHGNNSYEFASLGVHSDMNIPV
jgi:hypothetical protein